MEDLRALEEIFDVNIHVYTLQNGEYLGDEENIEELFEQELQADNSVAASLIRRPLGDKSENLYLHLYTKGIFPILRILKC